MPGSLMFYPTTDEHLIDLKKEYSEAPDINALADFIIKHRENIKFRFQDKNAIFYSDKSLAQVLIDRFWTFWIGSTEVSDHAIKLNKNEVACKRLPHGKYPYQVHLKKDTHRYFNESERKALWEFVNNSDSVHITHRYVKEYLSGQTDFCYDGYFYVKEEKVLTLLYMLAQNGINKVIKFIKEK
jgi:hypothetical protein